MIQKLLIEKKTQHILQKNNRNAIDILDNLRSLEDQTDSRSILPTSTISSN